MDFLLNILSYWDSALAVILVLGGLIFVHELGHFLANRAMGVGVVVFSVGMGPKLWGFKRGRTEYRLSWLPFGGFVAAVGEYSDEVEELGFTQAEASNLRPPWQRLLMAFAGPFANLLTAWLIYWGIAFSSGLGVVLPEIGEVAPDSAAEEAGLRNGDTILSIDGKPVDSWSRIPQYVGESGGGEMLLRVGRGEETLLLRVTPRRMPLVNIFGEEEEAWIIGVKASGAMRREERGLLGSAVAGLEQTWGVIDITLTSLKKMITGSVSADSVGGPIFIAQMLGEQAKVGIIPLLFLAALISVNLGLLNLLPVPVLDGGLILVCLIEMIIRRRIPEKIQERAMQAGVCLLIMLMVFATFNDIMRWVR
jgi:regulator of sigma E protease